MRTLASATLVAILAAGVAGAAVPARVVPWLDLRPVTPTAHPPLAVPCSAASLRAQLSVQGATGSVVGGITLRNAGSRPCSLLGWPKASFAGAAAATTRWRIERVAASPLPPELLADPPGSLRALRPGKSVWLSLRWSNWCGPGTATGGGSGAPPAALDLGLPGGTTVEVRLTWAPRCDSTQIPSTLRIGPFTPKAHSLPESSRLPLRAAILGVRPVAVKPGVRAFRARRGERFRYQVALTNPASRPFRFARASCPSYLEQASSAPPQLYVLNCRPVAEIRPHATVVFEMEIAIPVHARLGVAPLGWLLAPKTYLPPFANDVLWISS